FGYGRGRPPIFEAASFTARAGEVTVIVGANGSGKTTLLRLLGRLLRPAAGRVTIGGRDVAGLPRRSLARRIAFSPQVESAAWPLTVEQVVTLGRAAHRGWLAPMAAEDRAAARAALERTDLLELSGRPLTELSGGEHRRVLFARILAQEPDAVLLDEPTAHLDLRHQEEVLVALRELAARGLAVVVTLHDLNQAAAYADSVALLGAGSAILEGSPEDVLLPERLKAAYGGLDVAVARHPETGRLWFSPRGRAASR
ncbi:MAG: ABC transporter ATP-binding protein, partial [Acidobacteriota bacterium]